MHHKMLMHQHPSIYLFSFKQCLLMNFDILWVISNWFIIMPMIIKKLTRYKSENTDFYLLNSNI